MTTLNTQSTTHIIPPELEKYLYERGRIEERRDPMLLLRIDSKRGPLYVAELRTFTDLGTVATCYNPRQRGVLVLMDMRSLEAYGTVDPEFRPTLLSQLPEQELQEFSADDEIEF